MRQQDSQNKIADKKNKVPYKKYFSRVLNVIRGMWLSAGIPLATYQSNRGRLTSVSAYYQRILKSPIYTFIPAKWNELFIICMCKCGVDKGSKCECVRLLKIPKHVKTFFIDQCGPRLLTLQSINVNVPEQSEAADDVVMDEPQNVELGRPRHRNTMISVATETSAATTVDFVPTLSDESDYNRSQHEQNMDSSDEEMPLPLNVRQIKLTEFCYAFERAGISLRFAALLATSLLRDMGIDVVIDRHKISRELEICRENALKAYRNDDYLKCIFFDGKKENTLVQKILDGQPRNVVEKLEHISILKEPGSKFIGYATTEKADSETSFNSIRDYLAQENFLTDFLVAIGADGTPTNTGNKNGIISRLEKELKRPLQWLICLFHFNELPFRTLFIKLDGPSQSPNLFSGNIGKVLHTVETVQVNIQI